MAKFKDKQTGVIIEFFAEHDIEGLRKHPDYDEYFEEVKEEEPKKRKTKAE